MKGCAGNSSEKFCNFTNLNCQINERECTCPLCSRGRRNRYTITIAIATTTIIATAVPTLVFIAIASITDYFPRFFKKEGCVGG
ncbi:hypothetical protein AX774_g3650 [Zancudomyces culisetae]|uniref:Uncharacterized protein n=1 Tax=Zancudomyces culisetae TaxID=1213189 RepID=A0A1R1PPF0_ZANCU|nr:hypothetical protein AX774_g3650 [Zancudomyces culisetae]|eukprot:OMH82855.1 hypothetical protein AX774_g3650 [Zancudomyces culisetae]